MKKTQCLVEVGLTVDRILKRLNRENRDFDNRADINACIGLLRIYGRVNKRREVTLVLKEADLRHLFCELIRLSRKSRVVGSRTLRWTDAHDVDGRI